MPPVCVVENNGMLDIVFVPSLCYMSKYNCSITGIVVRGAEIAWGLGHPLWVGNAGGELRGFMECDNRSICSIFFPCEKVPDRGRTPENLSVCAVCGMFFPHHIFDSERTVTLILKVMILKVIT